MRPSPPPSDTVRELLELYRRHPQREERILARVRARRGALGGIDEMDLARDPESGITDQNHVGGARFVRELGERARVDCGTRVLDLGAGLGGSARVLAHCFGCRVHGVDLSEERCRQARRLTARVGLAGRVSFECADFLCARPVPGGYDVLWGQSAWGHVADKAAFVRRWAPALRGGGRVAFEDCYLRCTRMDAALRAELARLEDCWKSYLVTLPGWVRSLGAGYRIDVVEDLTARFMRNFARLAEHAAASGAWRREEVAGWQRAHRLAQRGVLGYVRVVATRRD